MQVGVGNNSSSSAGGGSGGVNRSVGQRIKEASLKEQQQLCSGSNGCAGGCGTLSGNGVCANSNGSGRVARTLYPGGGAATSSAVDLKQKRSAPMPLSDVQRNTIRVIGQYLRDLGMNDTVDSLIEESGCRIENSLAIRLQEYVLCGQWDRALDVIEKFKTSMNERQYLAIRVLLLEEKFKCLLAENEYLAALHLLQMDYPKEREFKERCDYLATTLISVPPRPPFTNDFSAMEMDGGCEVDKSSSRLFDSLLYSNEEVSNNSRHVASSATSSLGSNRMCRSNNNNNNNNDSSNGTSKAQNGVATSLECGNASASNGCTDESGGPRKLSNNSATDQQQGGSGDSGGKSSNNEAVLKILHKMLPPTFLLPPARLEELLKQSIMHQISQCELHVSSYNYHLLDDKAILKNHRCGNSDFLSKNIEVLYEHHAEVWCLEFSPCGQYLASGAKSNSTFVWKVDAAGHRLTLHWRFQVPADVTGISSISWSADSRYIAVASSEENASGVFIYDVQRGCMVGNYQPTPASSFSVVSFFKDGSHRFACGDQRGNFNACEVDRLSDNSKAFEGFRIRCIYSMKDGRTVLAADTHNRIRSYDFETQHEMTLIQESSQIIYFTVDPEEKYCLITTKTEGIRLWSLKTKNLVRSFFGSLHHEFVISTSFGGFHNNFIASGSEDDNVIIWNVEKSDPVRYLTGHTGTVNAVSWNPVLHGMMVSGSDDGTIRVWSCASRQQQC